MSRADRDNTTGKFVSRVFARLNPLTTTRVTIHRTTVTDAMVEAALASLMSDQSDWWGNGEYPGRADVLAALEAALAAREDER